MIKQREYSLVAKSYATALFNAATKAGQVARVRDEAAALAGGRSSDRVRLFLANPQISTETKLEYVDRALGSRFSPLLVKTLKLMIQRDRAIEFRGVLQLVQDLADQAEGIFPAVVESAAPLDATQRERLQSTLEKHTGKRLRIRFEVDPRLLGGLVFRFRDTLIDSSLAHGLEQLKRRLLSSQIA